MVKYTHSMIQPAASLKTIRVGHSPDPDDAFMFYAIARGRVPTEPFCFKDVVEDIESLNQRALKAELEVTAISAHALARVWDRYALMRCGASMGDRYGPVLVSTRPLQPGSLNGQRVAVPGELTTAALVLKLFKPGLKQVVVPFDEIPAAVKRGAVDLGLVIHESQVTYKSEGLHKVMDLGEWWAQETEGLPLPLGVDVIRKDLGPSAMREIALILKESIAYALDHRDEALEYALQFARGIGRGLADRFVGMYVNGMTLDFGRRGREGLDELFRRACERGLLEDPVRIDEITV